MGSFQMSVEGGELVIGELRRIVGRTKQLVFDAISENLVRIEGSAKENCPVDLGGLRQSIQYVDETSGDQIGGRVEVTAPYAAYVEFGTGDHVLVNDGNASYAMEFYKTGKGHMPAQPFLFPAFFDQQEILLKELNNILN